MAEETEKVQPVQAQYREMMNGLANGIDDILNGENCPVSEKKLAFCLVIAEFGDIDSSRMNYISNGAREDMVKLLGELLKKYTVSEFPPEGEA